MRFSGKTIVVTGAGAGLGRVIAEAFAREGGRLILADINLPGAEQTAAGISASGGAASAHQLDVADEAQIHSFGTAMAKQHPSIDVLVNNAGLAYGEIARGFAGLSLQKWQHFFTVNSIAPVLIADALRPSLARAKGLIVNQCSMAAHAPGTAYGITKATLNAITFAMAMQYASDEIRAVAIAPGMMETEASMASLPEDTKTNLMRMQLVRRQGKPEDIANAILFLASPEGSFINSETLLVDGGNGLRGWRP